MKEYYSIPLEDEEAQALLDISLLTNELVKPVSFSGNIEIAIENFESDSIATFWYENNHVLGLYFLSSELKKLPNSIGNFSQLRFLIISYSQIQFLPNTFNELFNLEYILFSNNAEDEEQRIINLEFPDIFKDLNNLKIFEIDGLFNVFLPPSFTELEKLEELKLSHCLFSPNYSNYRKNSELDIDDPNNINKFVYELPNDLDRIKTLKKLVLDDSGIKILPESLKYLPYLKELLLTIKNNPFLERTTNVEIVFEIKSLEKLILNYCNLIEIPETIENLTNLKELSLSHNQLQNLPIEIKNCTQLENLDLTWNDFKKELIYLKELFNLKYLFLDKTYENIIPKQLLDKKDLKIEEF